MTPSDTAQTILTDETAKSTATALMWPIYRSFLGVVLITAAILKAEELTALPILGPGLLNQRWLLTCTLEIEAVFGVWLLLGNGEFRTWVITLVLWCIFLGVAGYEAVSGGDSCGCFGRVQINPWYTAVFDLILVFVLLFCRARQMGKALVTSQVVLRWSIMGLIAAGGVAFGTWNLIRYSPRRLSEDGLSFADDTLVLEPEKWVGHLFILSAYIDIGPQLTRGDWIVLLYRYDCEHCQRVVPQYAALAKQQHSIGSPSVAFVEMPPFAPSGEELIRPSASINVGKLSEKHDWFVSTPIIIRLHEGIVRSVNQSDAAEAR